MNASDLKREAGVRAANLVQPGHRVGLGTGSTAYHAICRLAQRQTEEGLRFSAVSTSFSTSLLCQKLGIALEALSSVDELDIAIDGADEIDPVRNLIKGRGAAHTLEKIVAGMAKQLIIVADDGKLVDKLGSKFAVPVEVIPGAVGLASRVLREMGAETRIREGAPGKDGPIVSDSGNFILDARFAFINDPKALEREIDCIPGVVENGIFAGRAHLAIVATPTGIIEI